MESTGQHAAPNIEYIESLVLSLYQPADPEAIATTQTVLTQLQSSPLAWSIARDLLARDDEKVKFHGALIIIIKLNTESHALSKDEATELLINLIGWYIQALSVGVSPLVARKLSSALATFFLHHYSLWTQFIRHLTLCLSTGESAAPSAEDVLDGGLSALEPLGPAQMQAVLWVIENVMEDASKLDLNTEKNIGLYDVLRRSMPDAVALMSMAMSPQAPSPLTNKSREESIKCLQSWVLFTQRASARDKFIIDSLRPLVSLLINSLTTEVTLDASMELLVDIMANFPSLLNEEHYTTLAHMLISPWSHQRYQQLVQGDFEFESFQFGQLLLAFGEARVEKLICSSDEQTHTLLRSICGLLTASGYPAVEDKIFVPTLEFWSTYAEALTDEMYSAEMPAGSTGLSAAVGFTLQAVSNAWQKICYPPATEFSEWDTAERTSFNEARKEVTDLLQSTYALTGPKIVFTFAELVVAELNASSWARLEAAVFCLGSLADCVKEDGQGDEALHSVFSSPLFTRLSASQTKIPHRVRQTCVSLVERYTEYFERNVDILPATLNLLFSLVGEPGLTSQASKSIYRLCSSCRHHLFPEIRVFLDEYNRISTNRHLDCVSTERILGGISCVAQATPDEPQKLTAFSRILSFIEIDLEHSSQLNQLSSQETRFSCAPGSRCLEDTGDESPALHLGLRCLKTLASMGRGCQSPADIPIEVEDKSNSEYHYGLELSELQRRIFNVVLRVESMFPTNAEVIDTICSLLRTGFSESEPGPFVFPPKDVAQYLTGHEVHVPRIAALVSTACSFVSSVDHHRYQEKQAIFSEILLWVISLARLLPDFETDTELSQNTIDFSSRLITKSPETILQLQPFEAAEFLFLFTLRVLDGKEPLPKAASADFWASFMNLRISSPELQKSHSRVMETLGPLLARSLASNIGGFASRSELDKLSEPVKKLVSRYPSAKQWLESGFNHAVFPNSKVTAEQQSLFLRKLISLRGSRATNQVVRDFWLAARGSSFAYAS